MDLDPFTIATPFHSISTLDTSIEWIVENLEGSKWNAFNILGDKTMNS